MYSPGLLKLDAEWSRSRSLLDTLLRKRHSRSSCYARTAPKRRERTVRVHCGLRCESPSRTSVPAIDRAGWSVKIYHQLGRRSQRGKGHSSNHHSRHKRESGRDHFVLLGAGNAKEITFPISAPGRLVIEAGWLTEPQTDATSSPASLTISLVHSGEEKVYARRQGRSPLRIEQQIAESLLYGGVRWVVAY